MRREDPLEPGLVALYRAATPESKLLAVARLNGVLLGLKEAHLRASRPEMSPEETKQHLRRWWLGARD